MVVAVVDQHHKGVSERRAAVSALAAGVGPAGVQRLAQRKAGLPVRAPHRPGDDVLEAAERGSPAPRALREPVAVPPFDRIAAPAADRGFVGRFS